MAVIGALLAGVAAVPINPKAGERELGHILDDCAPETILCAPGVELPEALAARPRIDVDLAARGGRPRGRARRGGAGARRLHLGHHRARPRAPSCRAARSPRTSTRSPTPGSGRPTTSSPTGCRSSTSTASWSASLGSIRRGGATHHLGRFSSQGVAAALEARARRWSSACRRCTTAWPPTPRATTRSRGALRRARLLVSGSAALPAVEHERIERLSGQRIVERYGMSETLMNTSIRADGDRRAGYVGPPLDGVEIRLLDDAGDADRRRRRRDDRRDRRARAEPLPRVPQPPRRHRRGRRRTAGFAPATSPPARPTATSASSAGAPPTSSRAAATRSARGRSRARCSSTPACARPRSPASPTPTWASGSSRGSSPAEGASPSADELADHVASLLTPHKRPRVVHLLDELPRNEMGKVQKAPAPRRTLCGGGRPTLGRVALWCRAAPTHHRGEGRQRCRGARRGPRGGVPVDVFPRGNRRRDFEVATPPARTARARVPTTAPGHHSLDEP